MSSLDKLAIRGIRSFDDKSISVIEFFNPVTVIVGHNGSGKTTIIECLKYATTGDQPPNTKGGAFIHDPKMANEKEVKAQVKLRFNTTDGRKMLAVRNMSVTTKKSAGVTFKTLENLLAPADSKEKGGKRNVISTKCAEIDAEIPHMLGVSKAVLENVIFCHQEDSYWPLSEPSVLKKKFDDIFEATKYTKALENIKSIKKERVAELKIDKERLQALSADKGRADKLKTRVSDLREAAQLKQIEYEKLLKELEALQLQNARFTEAASKFRETFLRAEALEDKKKDIKKQLRALSTTITEIDDSIEGLQTRTEDFHQNVEVLKARKSSLEQERDDAEKRLSILRRQHVELHQEQGRLESDHKVHTQNIAAREEVIANLGVEYGISGFDSGPLSKDQVDQFHRKLLDLRKKLASDLSEMQAEGQVRIREMEASLRRLQNEAITLRHERDSSQDKIADIKAAIETDEAKIEESQTLNTKLEHLKADIHDKSSRIESIKMAIREANYDARLQEKLNHSREWEDAREKLTDELRNLNMQADSRAKLDLKRTEVKAKRRDFESVLSNSTPKFKHFTGHNPQVGSMEAEIDTLIRSKEVDLSEAEEQVNNARREHEKIEAMLANLTKQLYEKIAEATSLETKLKNEVDQSFESVGAAIKDATSEVNFRRDASNKALGSSKIWESLLKKGKSKHVCTACNRHLSDSEMPIFEQFLQDQIKKSSDEKVAEYQAELPTWEVELARLQQLLPIEARLKSLTGIEIPSLREQIKVQQSLEPDASELVKETVTVPQNLKRELKELSTLKQQSVNLAHGQSDITQLEADIARIEQNLAHTGSTRTANDVQEELDQLTLKIRSSERERNKISQEKDRQRDLQYQNEKELHDLEMQKQGVLNEIQTKTVTEERLARCREELVTASARFRDLDEKCLATRGPIELMETELNNYKGDYQRRIQDAQNEQQKLHIGLDKLEGIDQAIDRYIRSRGISQLRSCAERIAQLSAQITEFTDAIENLTTSIASIDKEIGEGGLVLVNLRENIRMHGLKNSLHEAETDLEKLDLVSAGEARAEFNQKFPLVKRKENELQTKCTSVGAEMSSLRDQEKVAQGDLAEYEGIGKRYTDHLIRVKMSDMANNDLEKYAKALDSAIMKYHSLKMEEVNDTMRHLWNKIYQGTDIDGIRIRSDSEGGANKRSYNYRVVMTKDQVEMDMRGRCSAGQKMLASIIIRLALSDSFSQNCGILALDEPTNALDLENIEALAASLGDLIKERKNLSNFQLIIITHDETFLSKLGQSDLMEFYWRVSRDPRQKSIIERQRVY